MKHEQTLITHPGCQGCSKTCNWRAANSNPDHFPQSKKRDKKGKDTVIYHVEPFNCNTEVISSG